MNNDIKNALWEAVKEPLRLMALAIVPVLITYFAALPAQWAVILTLLLRLLDSFLHEYAKEQPAKDRNEGLLGIKGLTGF